MIDISAQEVTFEEFPTGRSFHRPSGIKGLQLGRNAHYRFAIIQGAGHPEDWVETELLTRHTSRAGHTGSSPHLSPFERGTHGRPVGQMRGYRAANEASGNKPQSESTPPQTTTAKTKKTKQKYPTSLRPKARTAREALKRRFSVGARVSSPAKLERAGSIPEEARETTVSQDTEEISYKRKEGGLSSVQNYAKQDVNYNTNIELQDCYRIVLGSFKRPVNAEQLLQKLDSPEAMVVYVPKYHTYRVVYASYEKVETADALAGELLERYPQAWIVKF